MIDIYNPGFFVAVISAVLILGGIFIYRIGEIDEALKKIEEGSFGTCEGCKTKISKKRLKAIPYTRLCLKCQEAKEKR